jgi:chromosome segregation ATPase
LVADNEARINSTFTQLTHQNNQLKEKILKLGASWSEYRDNIATMQANLVAQQEENHKVNQSVCDLTTRLNECQANCTALEHKITDKDQAIAHLKRKGAE